MKGDDTQLSEVQGDALLSVVVPVYNGGPWMERCLDALLASDYRRFEIIVCDDGSTDGGATAWACRERGVEVLELDTNSGPAAARNRGAERARGGILLFVDADVIVRRKTLSRVAALLREQPAAAAVFGSYDDAPEAANFISQYKNLLHHFTHQQASMRAETFWAGCGAVRRAAFEAVGGFDEREYRRPSIEDIELGQRLRRAGLVVVLDKGLQVKHLKRWTFRSLLATDIFRRALPWSRLILRGDGALIDDLNLRVRERISAALVGLALVLLALSCFTAFTAFTAFNTFTGATLNAFSAALLAGAAAALASVFLLNLRLFRFFRERRGNAFAAASFVMLVLYYFYSGTVFALCYCERVFGKMFEAASPVRTEAKMRRGRDA
ncbi:MAG: glycosyltransferase family 2 protein [Acidobacteria bacterium]|nr:glycosyltransferase family 2 protein [Acidobacteriota bacterium]